MRKIVIMLLQYWTVLKCYIYDYKQNIKYSFTINTNSEDKSKARIMVSMHALEKGMSFSDKKEGWGTEKSVNLLSYLREHIEKYGKCDVVVIALNILKAYLEDDYSTRDVEVRKAIMQSLAEYEMDLHPKMGGTKSINYPEYKLSIDDILEFYSTRNSVRNFSLQEITNDEIKKAKLIAQTTPSACNRQASRIYAFKEKRIINQILDNQLGDQGWCNNANVLFVVTVNQSYFGAAYERSQSLIDGGMYAMNFMMGLHALKIASCFKMFVREPKRENIFKKITNIPDNEIPIALILAGHYKEDTTKSPLSHRIDI